MNNRSQAKKKNDVTVSAPSKSAHEHQIKTTNNNERKKAGYRQSTV